MKIEEISSYNFSSSFANKTSFGSPHGLKNITLIYIKTKCGISGIGEAYVGIYVPKLTSSIINEIKDFLIGKNPEELLKDNLHIPFVSRNGIFKSVYSAVDIALWDIVAKKKRKPLFRLLSNNTNNYKFKT